VGDTGQRARDVAGIHDERFVSPTCFLIGIRGHGQVI
jgi:hypothetical protein